jgi:MoxR-like ATPase
MATSYILSQILSLGSAEQICSAALNFTPNFLHGGDKVNAARELGRCIDAGYITATDIKSFISSRVQTPTSNLAQTAIQAVAMRAETTALAVKTELAQLTNELAHNRISTTSAIESLRRTSGTIIDRIDNTVGEYNRIDKLIEVQSREIAGIRASAIRAENIAAAIQPSIAPDPALVQAAVVDAVARAFKPFAQAVTDAGAQAAVGAMVSSTVIGRFPATQVFGLDILDRKGGPLHFDIWDHPETPDIDSTFIWSESILSYLSLAQDQTCNLWFGGVKGTGKTICAQQFAARTGRKFVRINFAKYTEPADYLGGTGIVKGDTEFQAQDFLTAYSTPGTVILLDEITNATAGNLAPLNSLLESNAAVNIGGKVWRRAHGVLVFAADNTMGNGDDTGRYKDTQIQNSALIDRFAHLIRFDFLPVETEVAAVVNHTKCSPELARHVIAAITLARSKVDTGDIVDAPSIRSVIAYIRALPVLTPAQAWASTIGARQPIEGAAALEAIRIASIDESFIANFI